MKFVVVDPSANLTAAASMEDAVGIATSIPRYLTDVVEIYQLVATVPADTTADPNPNIL